MNKMYEYLKEHNYISKNENKDPLRQQELSISRAKCIANKYDSLINEIQQENQLLKERINYLERSNSRREDTILEQRQEISDLEDNWNNLKEDLKNNIKYWKEQEKEWIKLGFIKSGGEANNKIIFEKILNKMEELEGSDSNVKD